MRITILLFSILLFLTQCTPKGAHGISAANESVIIPTEILVSIPPALPEGVKDSLDLKIGQMIMIGINERTSLAASDSVLRNDLATCKVGGIILFEKNLCKTNAKDSLRLFISDLQKASPVPLFMGIDEEGGKVHRLKEKAGFIKMPSAGYFGKLDNTDSTLLYSRNLGELLADLGFNINFAPCVDIAYNPQNAVIVKAERSYSSNWEVVERQASAFIEGQHDKGIKIAIKHYPGHGSSAGDTHKGIADVTKQWKWEELFPYKDIISSGNCDAVISCHIINCRLDTTCLPSTLSKAVNTDMLRNILGFKGVLFSDDMQMFAISKHYGLENAITMSINSGVDVLVFGNNVNEGDRITGAEIHGYIRKAVEEGRISMERIDEAYKRIMILKKKDTRKRL